MRIPIAAAMALAALMQPVHAQWTLAEVGKGGADAACILTSPPSPTGATLSVVATDRGTRARVNIPSWSFEADRFPVDWHVDGRHARSDEATLSGSGPGFEFNLVADWHSMQRMSQGTRMTILAPGISGDYDLEGFGWGMADMVACIEARHARGAAVYDDPDEP